MVDGSVVRFTIQGFLHDQLTVNTFWYEKTSGLDAAALSAVLNAFHGLFEDPYKAVISSEWTAFQMTAQQIFPTKTAVLVQAYTGVGEQTGDSLPSSVAVVLTKRTLTAGQRGRGRIYLPGVPVAWETDSQVTNTGLTNYTNLAIVMEGALAVAGETWEPVVCQANGTATKLIDAVDAQKVLRNQRRRQYGRGA